MAINLVTAPQHHSRRAASDSPWNLQEGRHTLLSIAARASFVALTAIFASLSPSGATVAIVGTIAIGAALFSWDR